MPDMRQMHPDLVGPSGLQPAGEKARHRLAMGPGETLQHLPMRYRLTPAWPHRPLVADMRVAIQRGINRAFRPVRRTPDESQIAAPQTAPSESGNRFCVRARFISFSERAFRAADRCPVSLKARVTVTAVVGELL